MRKHTWIFIGILILIIISLFFFDIQTFTNGKADIFTNNIKLISTIFTVLLPLFLIVVFLYLLFTNKWAFRVEKLSIGGFNVLFDNPQNLYKRQVRFFLDTKRTVFRINLEYDNFKETIDSYYEVYKFFRNEIKILGNLETKNKKRHKEVEKLYSLTNKAIKELNHFLTIHQSNYRRWYIYQEKNHKEEFYLAPVGKFQKSYSDYDELCAGFKKINEFFSDVIAKEFSINVEKWEE